MGRRKVSASDKLWTKVVCDPPCRCWRMRSSTSGFGYGAIKHDGRMHLAHRFAYELLVGPIPPGMSLHHTCRNPACVNPDHLELVTDAQHGERHQHDTCPKGHPLHVTPNGTRRCQICRREAQRVKRAALPPATRPPGRPYATVCINGHPLTGGNLYLYSAPDGYEHGSCRICRLAAVRRYEKRRKERRHLATP